MSSSGEAEASNTDSTQCTDFIIVSSQHKSWFFSKLMHLRKSHVLCDVELISGIDHIRVYAHRVVLCTASKYLMRIFEAFDAKRERITLRDIQGDIIALLVKFCYEGTISISVRNCQTVYDAALFLEMDEVIQECYRSAKCEVNVNNCFLVYSYALQNENYKLLKQSEVFIFKNFPEAYLGERFLALSYNHFAQLLTNDELHQNPEEVLFVAIKRWTNYDALHRTDFLLSLLTLIRLNRLSLDFIFQCVAPVCVTPETKALLGNALMEHPAFLGAGSSDTQTAQEQSQSEWVDIGSPMHYSETFEDDFWNTPETQAGIGEISEEQVNRAPVKEVRSLMQPDSPNSSPIQKAASEPVTPPPKREKIWKRLKLSVLSPPNIKSRFKSWTTPKKKTEVKTEVKTAARVSRWSKLRFWSRKTETQDEPANLENLRVEPTCAPQMRIPKTKKKCSKLLVVGSAISNKLSMQIYDPHMDSWSDTVLNYPDINGITAYGVVVFGGNVYIIGGYKGSGAVNTAFCISLSTLSVSRLRPMNAKRAGVSATEYQNRIYVTGGSNDAGITSSVECYDLRSNVWINIVSMSTRRRCHSSLILYDRLYVVGGFNDDDDFLRTAECYDLKGSSQKWVTCAEMNLPRFQFGLATLNGFMYAACGFLGNVCTSSIEFYDPFVDLWNWLTAAAVKRMSFGCAFLNDYLYVAGGKMQVERTNRVEKYDITRDEWTECVPLKQSVIWAKGAQIDCI